MFVITLKKAHNRLSFWTVLPNVEPCGDNLEQNESSVKLLKQRMRVPQVQPPRVGEQQLAYVQGLIDESMGLITAQDIVNLYQHTQGFFRTGHGSGSMNYNKYTILDTCIIIFLIQYS